MKEKIWVSSVNIAIYFVKNYFSKCSIKLQRLYNLSVLCFLWIHHFSYTSIHFKIIFSAYIIPVIMEPLCIFIYFLHIFIYFLLSTETADSLDRVFLQHTCVGHHYRSFLQQLGLLHSPHLPANLHERHSSLWYLTGRDDGNFGEKVLWWVRVEGSWAIIDIDDPAAKSLSEDWVA